MIVGRREGLGQNPNVSCRHVVVRIEDIIVAGHHEGQTGADSFACRNLRRSFLLKPDAKLSQQRFLTTGPKCGERALQLIDFVVRQQKHNTLDAITLLEEAPLFRERLGRTKADEVNVVDKQVDWPVLRALKQRSGPTCGPSTTKTVQLYSGTQ